MKPDGKALRDEALSQVEKNAEQRWLAEALAALHAVALLQQEVTTDDVWAQVSTPREPRALGALMLRGVKSGWIERTDRTQNSERPECHCRPVRVWRSLVYQPAQPREFQQRGLFPGALSQT